MELVTAQLLAKRQFAGRFAGERQSPLVLPLVRGPQAHDPLFCSGKNPSLKSSVPRVHQIVAAFISTSCRRRATIASSPGSNIQTPTTILLASLGMPALAFVEPVAGFSSILGVPARSCLATSLGAILTRCWS